MSLKTAKMLHTANAFAIPIGMAFAPSVGLRALLAVIGIIFYLITTNELIRAAMRAALVNAEQRILERRRHARDATRLIDQHDASDDQDLPASHG